MISFFKDEKLNELVEDEEVGLEEVNKIIQKESRKRPKDGSPLIDEKKREKWKEMKRKLRGKKQGEFIYCKGCPYVEKTKAFLGTGEIIESPKHTVGVEDKSPDGDGK